MFSDFIEFSVPIFKSVSVLILIVAYLVWLERKVAARIQSRIGPYLVGKPHGWLQPLADALKLMIKDDKDGVYVWREAKRAEILKLQTVIKKEVIFLLLIKFSKFLNFLIFSFINAAGNIPTSDRTE